MAPCLRRAGGVSRGLRIRGGFRARPSKVRPFGKEGEGVSGGWAESGAAIAVRPEIK